MAKVSRGIPETTHKRKETIISEQSSGPLRQHQFAQLQFSEMHDLISHMA